MNAASVLRHPGGNALGPGAAALTAAAIVWLLVLVASPIAASRGHLQWMAAVVYQAGSLICHQRPERSFHIDGVQLPVCARCFGLYASGALGVLLAWTSRRQWSARDARVALAAAAIPIVATVGLEWIGAIATTNLFRMATAVPLGLVGALVMIAMLRASGRDAPESPR